MVRKKKVSIYTLGEELGISPGTVSRALSNHPSISAETRARVKPLAEKYNFKPRLMSTRPLNLCLLIQKVPNHPLGIDEYVALTVEGVAEYCQEEKLEMSVYSGDVEALNRSDIVRELRLRTANGAIILRATDESAYLQQMDEQRFPYFSLTPRGKKMSDRELTLDYEHMGYVATRHLLSLGHRKIGIICDTLHSGTVNARHAGYVRALAEAGLAPEERLVYAHEPAAASFRTVMQLGAEGIEALLAQAPEMTAVFAIDDKIAYGAMTWLQLHQMAIPGQMSVVGVSDYPGSEFVYPPLTTVHVPYKAIGYETARQVHRLCRGMKAHFKADALNSLAPQLVIRNSTGPATNKCGVKQKKGGGSTIETNAVGLPNRF
jgi:LacI family transcriptional regulator